MLLPLHQLVTHLCVFTHREMYIIIILTLFFFFFFCINAKWEKRVIWYEHWLSFFLFFYFFKLKFCTKCRSCIFHKGGSSQSASRAFVSIAEYAQNKRWFIAYIYDHSCNIKDCLFILQSIHKQFFFSFFSCFQLDSQ